MTITAGAFPDTVSKEVRALLEEHLHFSNAGSSHTDHAADEQRFAKTFTPDGVYELGESTNEGYDAIIAFREQLFDEAKHRDHPVTKVFTSGTNDRDLMVFGTVDVEVSGSKHAKEWAGRYQIVDTGSGGLKFKHVSIIVTPLRDAA